jgi:glucan phosphoethanolaminetransferase (alkaline phosphatase superfamily)
VGDLLYRGARISNLDKDHKHGYEATAFASFLLWTVLLYGASKRRSILSHITAFIFIISFGIAVGVQGSFRALFNLYCGIDALVFLNNFWRGILGALPLSKPVVLAHFFASFGLAILFVRVARTWVKPRKWPRRFLWPLVPAVLVGITYVPSSYRYPQSSTPDVIYFHGLVTLAKQHLKKLDYAPYLRPPRRTPESVPSMEAKPAAPRNVLFILQESQRADVTCIAFDPQGRCVTLASNYIVPERLPLTQMRSVDSATAISLGTLLTGLAPIHDQKTTVSAPTMFEYAHAAGIETAYWTSQNLMFQDFRLFVQDSPIDHFVSATNIDPAADFDYGAPDGRLTDRVIRELREMKEPFFGMVHYSNQHMPYLYDARFAPYQPTGKPPIERMKPEESRNYYKDVVYLSDIAVGRLLASLRASPIGQRTVVVFTADHGEALRDHSGWGHTWALWEDQIHVPTWIYAPPGTITPEEERSLRAVANAYTYHLDLSATLLDLMGLWDSPQMAPFKKRMPGHALTRGELTTEPVPMSNCSWIWECIHPNYGVMQGPLKLLNFNGDKHYRCVDIVADPGEKTKQDMTRCQPLLDLARTMFIDLDKAEKPFMPIYKD